MKETLTTVDFLGQPMDGKVYEGALFVPSMFAESPNLTAFVSAALAILANFDPAALKTMWLIGSTNIDISGRPRIESESHSGGRAFDMSPMFTSEMIMSPDGESLSLAWNIMSLAQMGSRSMSTESWVVEGDHIHVEIGGDPAAYPDKEIICVPTLSSWYDLNKKLTPDGPAKTMLLHGMFIFDPTDMSYMPADPGYISALRQYLQGKQE